MIQPKKFDVQYMWNPWLSFGIHIDHKAPYLAIHLPGVWLEIGFLNQPGMEHSLLFSKEQRRRSALTWLAKGEGK